MTTITTLTAWPTPSCRMFCRELHEVFSHIQVLGPIWRNLPPAVELRRRRHRTA
ncbi:hypothetical protein [Nonomuraea sp. NPDC050783]|uniref:hypothetical protein n=1 Tax=Nonomuraea sp. NPDC050783 TaxID=3154634 RepID=UPI0034655106